MAKPTEATLKRKLRELRVLIEDPTTDIVTVRIAHSMEYALMWATEETVGWPSPAKEAISEAETLKNDLNRKSARQGGTGPTHICGQSGVNYD